MAERPKSVPAEAEWDASYRRWRTGKRGSYGQAEDGEHRSWNAEGVLIAVENWSNRLQDGIWETWYENGAPSGRWVYEKGQFKSGVVQEQWRHPENKDVPWHAFGKKVVPQILHAQAQLISGKWENVHYFDDEGVERGPRGKAIDKELAKQEKKKTPSAQDKLAALVKKKG